MLGVPVVHPEELEHQRAAEATNSPAGPGDGEPLVFENRSILQRQGSGDRERQCDAGQQARMPSATAVPKAPGRKRCLPRQAPQDQGQQSGIAAVVKPVVQFSMGGTLQRTLRAGERVFRLTSSDRAILTCGARPEEHRKSR